MEISLTEYSKRRKTLMQMIGGDGIAIIPSANHKIRNRDVDYPFRQDSDFYYITGFNEPEAVAILIPNRKQGQFVMFCRERNKDLEIWNGVRAGQDGAVKDFGVDDAFPIANIDEILPGLLEHRERVYYTMGRDIEFDQRLVGWVNGIKARSRAGHCPPHEFIALDYLLHDLRLYKSPAEVSCMKKAVKASVAAHLRAMSACEPGKFEYEIEAELLYEFRKAGCVPAYPSIVAAGKNGCILHYVTNNAQLADGDLLLIDAGAEYAGYAADITRTYPVNGSFTPAQREVYELVLEAQQAAIKKVKPGNHWNDPHDAAVYTLTRGLIELGCLKGKPAKLVREKKYHGFYMHRTGHWLGLDVHDVGEYRVHDEWRLLEPGMALTIEPGLYFAAKSKGVPKRYWNIAIRIEDDVLVTRDGGAVLTAALIKSPREIESYMAQTQR